MPEQEPLHIAIVGGSLGGCCLALGLHLLNRPEITFDVFEAWTFGERGAGIGIAPNGQKSLRELGVDADALLERAGAFKEERTEGLVAYGPHEGAPLLQLPGGIQCVLRTDLLSEILKLLPQERLHANKKLESVVEGERLVLNFADGTSHSADALIGCDGLRSTVRSLILGQNHPSVPPKFTGYWDGRCFMTSEEARAAWGSEIIDHAHPREHFKIGNGTCMLFASAPKGKAAGVVVAGAAGAEEMDMIDNPKKPMTREFLERHFGKWEKEYVGPVIEQLLNPKFGPGIVFGEYEAQDAETWWRDRMCIMGDAAHAALPWMGQGFSMAAEDAAILTKLLTLAKTRQDLCTAFQAFDKARNGPGKRPDFVIKKNYPVAEVCAGQRGLDPAKALEGVEDLRGLFEHVWNVDMKEEIQIAVDFFNEIKSRGG